MGDKRLGWRICWVAAVWLFGACAPFSAALKPASWQTPLPHSLKGYELYSWQSDGEWHFTLITGANREKTVEEITSAGQMVTGDGWVKIRVQGVEALEGLLAALPGGEEVLWVAPGWAGTPEGPFQLPSDQMIESIQRFCTERGIELVVSR